MIVSGRRALNPRYIRDLRIEEDEEGVMLRIVAYLDRGGQSGAQAGQSVRGQ